MDWLDWEPILKKQAVSAMEKAPNVSEAHKLDHLERVWSRCLKLGMKLNADLEVLVAAAFLHDLGRHYGLDVHGEKSALLARPILEKIKFPKEKTKKVLDCISLHDHNTPKGKRKLVEAQILYDADKLDAFGAVGVVRWVIYYYARGESVEGILSRLEDRYRGLHLKESKEIAEESYLYAVGFFKKLREDLKVE
jgi:uncharacterized protein